MISVILAGAKQRAGIRCRIPDSRKGGFRDDDDRFM